MAFPWAAVATLAGSGLDLFGAKTSADAAKRNTDKQIAWEKERAKNAHQWEVQDLQAAGLNPVLSAGGSGAVTGSISPQMPDTSGYSQAGAKLANLIPTITAIQNQQTNTAKQKAEINKINTENGLIELQKITEAARKNLISKQAAREEIEKLLRQKDLDYYDEAFRNRTSYNIEGTSKALTKILTDTLNTVGLNDKNLTKVGESLFHNFDRKDSKRQAKEFFKKLYNKYGGMLQLSF